MLTAPTSSAPAARMRATNAASQAAGGLSSFTLAPARVTTPSMSNKFLAA